MIWIHMLSRVLAVMNVHGFDKDAVVFSNLYHMYKANGCPYSRRQPIDIEAAVGTEGNLTSKTYDTIVKDKVRHVKHS